MQDVSSSGAGASAWQGAGATAHAREAEGKPPPPGASPGRVLEILQRLRSIECLVMLAAALTVAALLLHDRLTTRRIEFRAVDSTQRFQPYAYDDSSNGGNSLARVDRTRPLAWDCDLRRGFAWPYCGFGLLFDRNHQGRGVDLSGYTRLRIRLSYEGSAALLRIALKNHDAPHAPLANAPDKVNQLSWPLHRHENTIDLPMEDFAVADWWKDQTKAPVALAQPGFGNVVAMEFISGTDAAPGPQRFRIESVSFERQVLSPAGFYGALVGFWIILIAFVLSARQRQLNRIRSSAQLALSESEQLYRTMLDASTDTIVLFDANGRAEFVNSSAVAAMEIDGAASVLGKHWTELWGSGTAAAVADAIRTTVAGQAARCQAFWPTARGTPKWWDVAIVPLYRQRVLKGTLTISRDVTEDRDRAEQLRWASEHDALTQLPNRRAFQMRLQAAALRAMGNGDQLGLLLIDLDHFKHINDTLGHSAGDELMKKIGGRLRKGIRHNDFVARVGGDEFALLVQVRAVRSVAASNR